VSLVLHFYWQPCRYCIYSVVQKWVWTHYPD